MRFDGQLLLYYLFIMLLQYQYTLWGQLAAKEAGGKEGGLTITIAVSQIAVCAAYACLLWVVGYNPVTLFGLEAPRRQPLPTLTTADLMGMGALSFCYAAAHSAGHYSLTIGHFAFAQIVKAAHPEVGARAWKQKTRVTVDGVTLARLDVQGKEENTKVGWNITLLDKLKIDKSAIMGEFSKNVAAEEDIQWQWCS